VSHKHGAHVDGIDSLEALRLRCVCDSDSGCWHLRTARGRLMPRDRVHRVWVFGRGAMTATRAAWMLAGKPEPARRQVVYRSGCDSFDCVAPEHLRCGSRKQAMQAAFRLEKFETAPRREAVRVLGKARQVITAELRLWLVESSQRGPAVAHALGVSLSRVRAIRREANKTRSMGFAFSAPPVSYTPKRGPASATVGCRLVAMTNTSGAVF